MPNFKNLTLLLIFFIIFISSYLIIFSDNSFTKLTRMEEVASENRFKCHICSKSFKYRSDFERHERIHTGKKPFQCDICNKSFAFKSALVSHKRIHTADKPFQCEICNKSYTRRNKLNLHMKTHAKESFADQ